jgi:hypothetical protein
MSLFGTGVKEQASSPAQQKVPILAYQVQSSCQGAVIPLVYGQTRIPGNILWAANFKNIPNWTSSGGGGGSSAGGKGLGGLMGGGGGGGSMEISSYNYYMSVIIGLCIGPITGVVTVYIDSTSYPVFQQFQGVSLGARPPASVWSWLSQYSPGQALAYSGIAIIYHSDLSLGTGDQLANFNFEVSGLKPFNPSANIIDANPADILLDFLTNDQYGCGWPESLVGDLTQYSNYCLANGLLLSPQFTTQMTGADIIKYLMDLSNSEVVWSGGQLQVVPYGDSPATGFPLEYLTDSQRIPTGSPPTITISPWTADYGVLEWIWDANNQEWLPGGDMTEVASNPSQGQYSVNNGVYTFNALDVGTWITINYGAPNPASPPVTFTPDLTPKFNLGIDDFIADKNQDPVTASRTAISDAKNWMRLEIFDRSANYDTALVDVKDQNAIDLYGPRIDDNKECHAITNQVVAQFVGQTMLQKSLYVRNTYKFKLDGRYIVLDPMDWVSLTVPKMGLNQVMCRIVSLQENDDGSIDFTAEEWPDAIATPALYTMQGNAGLQKNYNADPGNIYPPIIFEAPVLLTQQGYEVWVAGCGGPNWGGAEVWTSLDGTTHKRLGLLGNPARMGILAAQFPAGSDPDTTDTCQVNLSESNGVLTSGTQQDADNYATALWVDGEIISYTTATLTGPSQYSLGNYLRRGAYLTPITAHAENSRVCRLDQAIFKIPYDPTLIGQTLYIKFLSYNIWHGATQELSDVEPYTFLLTGDQMDAGLPAVTGLSTYYQGGLMYLAWNNATDPLASYRQMDYEVRKGTAWGTAEVVGRTLTPGFPCYGDGTYFVASHYDGRYGTPASISVTNTTVLTTILASGDEYGSGWLGTMSGGVFKDSNGDLEISGAGPGYYTIPAGELVNLGSCKLVVIAATYTFESVLPTQDVDSWPDWDAIPDVDGLLAGASDVEVQIKLSTDGSTWGAWQPLRPGQYYAWKINIQLLFTVYQPGSTPIVSEFKWMVGQ